MTEEMITYLIGIVPGITMILGMVPVVFKLFSWVRQIFKRDNNTQARVDTLVEKLDQVLADNAAIRKENLALRRQNNKLMTKLTGIYQEDKEA